MDKGEPCLRRRLALLRGVQQSQRASTILSYTSLFSPQFGIKNLRWHAQGGRKQEQGFQARLALAALETSDAADAGSDQPGQFGLGQAASRLARTTLAPIGNGVGHSTRCDARLWDQRKQFVGLDSIRHTSPLSQTRRRLNRDRNPPPKDKPFTLYPQKHGPNGSCFWDWRLSKCLCGDFGNEALSLDRPRYCTCLR